MLKPLRPIFVSPASTFSTPRNELNYYPVVCVSASKLAKESDVRERGFAYVQGAGDDHETWAKGLTPGNASTLDRNPFANSSSPVDPYDSIILAKR